VELLNVCSQWSSEGLKIQIKDSIDIITRLRSSVVMPFSN